jgi:hypothetical protein
MAPEDLNLHPGLTLNRLQQYLPDFPANRTDQASDDLDQIHQVKPSAGCS